MKMDTFASVDQVAQELAAGRYSSREIVEDTLQRAKQDTSNAFITVDEDAALLAADAADRARAQGSAGPLSGVPFAHKDIFCTAGTRTTAGSRMLESFIAPYDATVVQRCSAAGMVCIGKTNMDEFAMGSSNETSFFGAVTNPWSDQHVPGGSSGGSAAAVAAGLVPAATGTDTGGSIRQPASFCGITGLKPTYGRVSRFGMIAFASSLDQGGPMTRSALDAARLLAVMSGFDPRDSTSVARSDSWLQDFEQGVVAPAEALTIGLPQEYFASYQGDSMDELRRTLEQMGHKLVDISLPNTDAAIPAYYVIAGAEASTNLSRYDGVRFGHRCENPESLEDLYCRSRDEGFGAEVKRRILTGTYALSVGYFDAYYLKAQKIRRLIADDFATAFGEVDVLLSPTTPGPAFRLNELTSDPVAMYQQDRYTVPVSLAGLPAMSIPCGIQTGLPVGAQLIAPHFREDLLLRLAVTVQEKTDYHLMTPVGGAA